MIYRRGNQSAKLLCVIKLRDCELSWVEAGGTLVSNPWVYDRRKDSGKVESDTAT